MKIMALDYGDARTGVALSDLTGSIVGRVTVIHSWKEEKVLDELEKLVRENAPAKGARAIMQILQIEDSTIDFFVY